MELVDDRLDVFGILGDLIDRLLDGRLDRVSAVRIEEPFRQVLHGGLIAAVRCPHADADGQLDFEVLMLDEETPEPALVRRESGDESALSDELVDRLDVLPVDREFPVRPCRRSS